MNRRELFCPRSATEMDHIVAHGRTSVVCGGGGSPASLPEPTPQKACTTRHRYTSPNTVTPDIAYVSPYLCFLQHSLFRLCYDGVAYAHTDRAPGREETRWTLSRFWIR